MVDLPETLFKEASNSLKNFEASETGIVTVEELADEIPGGFVAGVLELFSLDMATFALPPPEVNSRLFTIFLCKYMSNDTDMHLQPLGSTSFEALVP